MRRNIVVMGAYIAVVLVAALGQFRLSASQHEQHRKDVEIAKSAFIETCHRQNDNRDSIGKNGRALSDLIDVVLPFVHNESVLRELKQVQSEVDRGEHVDCSFPPKKENP